MSGTLKIVTKSSYIFSLSSHFLRYLRAKMPPSAILDMHDVTTRVKSVFIFSKMADVKGFCSQISQKAQNVKAIEIFKISL